VLAPAPLGQLAEQCDRSRAIISRSNRNAGVSAPSVQSTSTAVNISRSSSSCVASQACEIFSYASRSRTPGSRFSVTVSAFWALRPGTRAVVACPRGQG